MSRSFHIYNVQFGIYTLLEMNQREKFFFVIFIFLVVSSRVELQWCLNDMFLCMCI